MNNRTLRDILARFRGQRVLIVGDVMLDEYIWGEVQRISPEAPVPVVNMRHRTYVPGGAANVATNVASLGGSPLLVGVVGDDQAAEQLGEALRQQGVDTTGLLVDEERQTTLKTRVVACNQQVLRIDCEQRRPLSAELEAQLIKRSAKFLPGTDACIVSDYGKGVVSERFSACFIDLARQVGKPVVVDPKGTDYAKYRGATLVKPNVHEVEHVLGYPLRSRLELLEAGEQLIDLLQGSAVLISRGEEGMSLFRPGSPPQHFSSAARSASTIRRPTG